MKLQVEILDLRRMLKEKCEEIFSDKSLACMFYERICEIEEDDRFTTVDLQEGRREQLKEQEPSKIVMSPFDEEWYGSTLECTTCGCRWMMSDDAHVCCCPHCGRKVKWE